MLRLFVFTLLLAGLPAGLPARADTACAFASRPHVLIEEGEAHARGSRLLQMWEVADHPVLWSETAPQTGEYRRFREELAERRVDTDPLRLLERSPTENNRIVIRNADRWIRPAGCLEMLMIGHQHGRLNTFDTPSEFASIILRSPDGDRLRVYYYTINEDGIGRMDPIVEPALEDRRQGWDLLVALHSHVFHPGQPAIDGILAPSEPDADFHLRLHAQSAVREAWITNGVRTVRMPASRFGDFRRPADDGTIGKPADQDQGSKRD